ncbi:MAG: DUF2225 domain-containing protein [Clostridiaceae bacterium]|nr:DUF2225 domain-containing protein [Clostridiaceae bacterium]
MNNSLYSKKVTCPICGKEFSSLKAKVSSCKVKKKDEDFCIHYEDTNPMYYEIFVCPFCAYAAPENSFGEMTEEGLKLLKGAFLGREVGRSFCAQRSLKDAIAVYKLAIYTAELIKAKASMLAGLCLKLAWLYRFKGDKQEELFLNYSLRNYLEAFNKEPLPIGNLNEISLMYLLGELSRRIGKFNDAITWFGKAAASPERKENPKIEKLVREQWVVAREQHKENEKPG